ncbi:tape measure protein [Acinetobacter guillouiae]|uniref:tape measure protein n=1 Tax=Acinetobacter guillouiae TaxID=106649 RepID=UPI0026E14A0C|nr:tape measure protein [Acinetobacter guillouiae]MDO6646198.1 tape measure protein [Acinetobacter guillouiae]
MATKLGSLTLDLICRTGNFTQGMRDASNTASRELGRIEQSTNGATKAIKGLAVAALGSFSIHQVIAYTDSYTNLQNRLKLVTNSQQELSTATQDTFNIAQATAQSWGSVAQVYQRFAENSSRLGITMQQTASLTDTVSKAISISGASAASAEAALMQFGQALASGVLRGEEFNSIAEQAPALLKAIATGLGVNIGELRKMAGEGQLTGDVVIKALNNAKTSVDNLFSKTDFTIAQSFTQLNDSVTKFVGEAGSGSGAAKTLASSIKMVADNIEPIANTGAAIAVGVLAKAMVGATVSATNATYSLFAKIDATLSERQANIAATQAEVASATAEARSTEITLINAKATHTQIMAEIELEKVRLSQQITNQGRMATMTRMAQLGQLQAQVALEIAAAETAQTASSARLSAALTAQAAVTSRLALGKAALMALFSPMGIAIAATAAAFYYLSSSAEEVKESLATQSDSVENLTKKYLELNSVQAQVESVRLRKEIDSQNDSIDDAASSMTRFAYLQKELFKISGNDYVQYKQAIESIKTGAGDASAILQKMVISGRFSQDQIDKLVEYSGAVADARKNINQNKTALDLLSQTSGAHTVVNEKLNQQIATQSELTKIATKDFLDLKNGLVDSLEAQVEYVRLNGGSEQQITNLNKVIKDYSLNQISATNAVKRFNGIAELPNSILSSLQNYATKTDKSKVEVNLLAGKVKELNGLTGNSVKSTDERTAAHEREKSAIEGTKKAYAEYSKTALSNIKEMAARAQMQKMGFSENKIAERMAVLKALNFDPTLAHSKTGIEMKKIADISAKMKDTEDAKADAIKAQNKELEKQNELRKKTINSKTIDSVIARGEGNYNSFNKGKAGDSVGSKLNLVDMTVGQIRALQKNGSIFAAGKYQNIPSTLQGAIDAGIVSVAEKFNANVQERIVQQYLLTAKKDRGSIEDYIKSKSDNLYAANLDLAKEFASVASPVTGKSYYDGKAGNKASISVKEAQNALKASRELYTQAIASGKSAEEAWKAAFSGSISFIEGSDEQKSLEKLASYKEKLAQERTALIEFYNDWQKLENNNSEQVKKIRETFAKDPKAMEDHLALQEVKYQEDVENYIKAGDDRVKADYQATQDIIDARQAAFDNINNPIYSMRDKGVEAQAQASMTPVQYQSWQLNKEQQDGYASLGNDLIDSVNAINESQILSEQEKYDQLKSAHEDYVNSKASLDLLYDKQTKDLARSQQEEQINMWGGILSTAQNTFSQLAQSAKDGAGEQSSVYRTMFAMQQAFSIASSMVAAYTAYSTAFADPSAMTLTQKFAGGAAVMAALMPAITSISSISLKGMAHNGIDNIPSEGTWLLDGGERVLNPQQNKDLTNYLANSKSQGPSIVINNNAQTNVSARQGSDGKMYVTIDEVQDIVAGQLRNPNSQISKSVQQNTTATRRR